jgi:hypothetical protein
MTEKQKDFLESLENNKKTPRPETRDLILIDGRFAQYGGGYQKIFIRFIDDNSKVVITEEDWNKYFYEKPPQGIFLVGQLVENGLMTKEQLEKVYWGPEQETNPRLKGEVGFFGIYKSEK